MLSKFQTPFETEHTTHMFYNETHVVMWTRKKYKKRKRKVVCLQ